MATNPYQALAGQPCAVAVYNPVTHSYVSQTSGNMNITDATNISVGGVALPITATPTAVVLVTPMFAGWTAVVLVTPMFAGWTGIT